MHHTCVHTMCAMPSLHATGHLCGVWAPEECKWCEVKPAQKGLIPRPPVSNVTFHISRYYKVVPSLTGTNMDVGEQRLNWFGLLGARKFWISFTVWNKMKLWSYLAECLLLKTHLAPFGFHNLPCNLGKSTQSTFTNTNKEVKRILKH